MVQQKPQGGSVLHIRNAMTGRISPIYLSYSRRWLCHLYTN